MLNAHRSMFLSLLFVGRWCGDLGYFHSNKRNKPWEEAIVLLPLQVYDRWRKIHPCLYINRFSAQTITKLGTPDCKSASTSQANKMFLFSEHCTNITLWQKYVCYFKIMQTTKIDAIFFIIYIDAMLILFFFS